MTAPAAWDPVRERLTTASGAVGYASSRVYPVVLPQRVKLPAYTYQVITAPREHAFQQDPGEVHARVQVSVHDSTYLGTASGAKHARDALSRYQTTFKATATGTVVHDIYLDNERDAYLAELENSERSVWRKELDFIVHYQE